MEYTRARPAPFHLRLVRRHAAQKRSSSRLPRLKSQTRTLPYRNDIPKRCSVTSHQEMLIYFANLPISRLHARPAQLYRGGSRHFDIIFFHNFSMSRRFTIGRERSCDVPVADDSVSRVHAEIWLNEDGSLMLADRGSSNGTILIRARQASPLTQAIVVAADEVRLGNVTLSVADLISAVESRNPGALAPPAARPAPVPKGSVLIRCECGAVKTYGEVCPACHQ
jgi:hypothetical protein